MTFRKYAQLTSLGAVTYDLSQGVFQREAKKAPEPPTTSVVSAYVDGKKRIDVQAVLNEVADRYAISRDPSDYIYEVVRAVTASAPNENGDAFPRDELLRYDNKRGQAVYATFAKCPHHVNHRTAEEKNAMGVVLDAHYHDEAPALAKCPACASPTAEREQRDASGLHCKCGTVVKDEYTEILIAVDANKDPTFAEGVRRGQLNATSMGCDCEETSCLVCGKVARSEAQFCKHIRGSAKRQFWSRLASGEWSKISSADVERELRARGAAFVKAGFRQIKLGDYEVRRSVEDCRLVTFREQSRVAHPADPRALQIAILEAAKTAPRVASRHQRVAAIRVLEDQLRLATLTAPSKENEGGPSPKRRAATADRHYLVRVNGSPEDVHAGRSLKEALLVASPDPEDRVEAAVIDAPHAGAAVLRSHTAQWDALDPAVYAGDGLDLDADVQVTVPDGKHVQILDEEGNPEGAPMSPDELPQGGGDAGQPSEPPGGMPPVGPPPSNESFPVPPAPGQQPQPPQNANYGVAHGDRRQEVGPAERQQRLVELGMESSADQTPTTPTRGASARKPAPKAAAFASAYDGQLWVDVFHDGHAKVGDLRLSDEHPLFIVQGAGPLKTTDDLRAFGRKIEASVHQLGLVPAMNKLGGRFAADGAVLGLCPEDATSVTETMEPSGASAATGTVAGGDVTLSLDPSGGGIALSVGGSPGLKIELPVPGGHDDSTGGEDEDDDSTIEAAGDEGEDAGGDASASASSPAPSTGVTGKSAADVEAQTAARYRKLYAAKEAALREELAETLEAERKTLMDRVARTLRIAARRRALNLERSPLKIAISDSLMTKHDIGQTVSGRIVEWQPVSEPIAMHHIEAGYAEAGDEEIETLIQRTGELLAADDAYLATAEYDLKRQASVLPFVLDENVDAQTSEARQAALEMREEASTNNLPVAPSPRLDPVERHSAVRGILSDGSVARRLAASRRVG